MSGPSPSLSRPARTRFSVIMSSGGHGKWDGRACKCMSRNSVACMVASVLIHGRADALASSRLHPRLRLLVLLRRLMRPAPSRVHVDARLVMASRRLRWLAAPHRAIDVDREHTDRTDVSSHASSLHTSRGDDFCAVVAARSGRCDRGECVIINRIEILSKLKSRVRCSRQWITRWLMVRMRLDAMRAAHCDRSRDVSLSSRLDERSGRSRPRELREREPTVRAQKERYLRVAISTRESHDDVSDPTRR